MTAPDNIDDIATILVSSDNLAAERKEARAAKLRRWGLVVLVVGAALAVAAAAFFGFQAADANGRLSALENAQATSSADLEAAEERILELEKTVAERDATIEKQDEKLTSREGFIAVVQSAAPLIEEAMNKVDTSGLIRVVDIQQNRVEAEGADLAVVADATVQVQDAIGALRAVLDEYNASASEREQMEQSLSRDEPSTPSDASDTVLAGARAALDAAGGTWVGLGRSDVVCGLPAAIACAHSDGTVMVANRVAGNNRDYWLGPMAHEYAHQIQFKNWEGLLASPTLASLFSADVPGMERLADCMAVILVSSWSGPYQPQCNPEQLAFAQRVWTGVTV